MVGRASASAGKEKKRKSAANDSESSDDSDDVALENRKKSKHIEKEVLKEKEAQRTLRRELEAIRAKNEEARAKIVDARNDFPVLIVNVSAKCSVIRFLTHMLAVGATSRCCNFDPGTWWHLPCQTVRGTQDTRKHENH